MSSRHTPFPGRAKAGVRASPYPDSAQSSPAAPTRIDLSREREQDAPGRTPLPRRLAHVAIRSYQLTLSGLIGRQCRHLPSCSEYTDEAIRLHGFWVGGWMGAARICRCGPFGTSGLDLVPETLPAGSGWYKPWSYGRWRGVNAPAIACETVEPDGN